MKIFAFAASVILLLILLFALQNPSVVSVSFLTFHFDGSLALVLLVVFAAGLITGVLMMLPTILRKILAIREQRRLIKQLADNAAERRNPSSSESSEQGPDRL